MNRYVYGSPLITEDGHISPIHKHAYYEIVYYGSCSGTVEIGNRSYKFHRDCIALIYPNVFHGEHHTHGGNLSFVGFDTDFPDMPPQGIFYAENEHIHRLIKEIYSEIKHQERNFDLMLSAKIAEILVYLSRCSDEKGSILKDISFVKNYIDENYNGKIDFNLLASLCGYSYSTLRHKFKLLYGDSPQNYLIKVRLENAYNLLKTGEFNCTEICYRCGFSNSSQFSKMFKQKYGVSPREIIRAAK